MHEINTFREMNNRMLEILLNDSLVIINTNKVYDIKKIIVDPSPHIKTRHKHIGDSAENKKIKRSYNNKYKVLGFDNSEVTKNKEIMGDSHNTALELEPQENNVFKKSKKSKTRSSSLDFYNTLNDYKMKNNGILNYTKNNKLHFFTFLNKDWAEHFSITHTGYLTIDFSSMKLSRKLTLFSSKEKFGAIHQNLYLFLNVFNKKYNITIPESSVDCVIKNQKLILQTKDETKKVETAVLSYLYYIFDKYSEFLLKYYIGSI